MRNLLVLFGFILAVNTMAVERSNFYRPEFKIIGIEEICPEGEGEVSCEAEGLKVHVMTTLMGCLDEITEFDYEVEGDTIIIDSEAYTGWEKILCFHANEVIKTIVVTEEAEDFKLLNERL